MKDREEKLKARIDLFTSRLAGEKLDGLIVSGTENRRYLSGFSGSAGLLYVAEDARYLLTDSRYSEQAEAEAPHFEILEVRDLFKELGDIVDRWKGARIGFESEHLTYSQHEKLVENVSAQVEWKPISQIIEKLRMVKTQEEIELIQKAAAIGDRCFDLILEEIRPGITERELAIKLEYLLKREGAEEKAFQSIIASGVRGSLPHASVSDRELQAGELVTFDFGAIYEGYASDMTRTVAVFKDPDPRSKEVYEVVLTAQRHGLEVLRSGIGASEIDKEVRNTIEERGYGEYFRHSTGHGVGLSVHESPSLSEKSDVTLKEGMVVTVEPGIYIPGWGGVRIEDLVVITADGCQRLTESGKELKVI